MKLLTKLRVEKGWSLNELARKATMANGDIGKIESGRLIPYSSQLEKISKALNYPIGQKEKLLEEVALNINHREH